MPDFSGLLGLFEHFKRLQKNIPLTFPVSDLSHGPTVGVFDGGRSGYADGPMKFISGCEDNG
jgi:hypothetical protein